MNRRELECLLEEESAATGSGCRGREETARTIVEEMLQSKAPREHWMMLLKLICEKYPHCIMYGVHIADGMITSCENLQQSFSFGPSPDTRDGVDPVFGPNWKELEALCKRMRAGRLAELRFCDGRPTRAKTTPEGRIFKSFFKKD